jgi:hypothetical protein
MGTFYPYGMSTRTKLKEFILSDYYHDEGPVILKHRSVSAGLWILMQTRKTENGQLVLGQKFIIFSKFSQHDKTWGYKDMEVCSHPFQYDCPMKFIDEIEENGHPYAEHQGIKEMYDSWRENVLEYHKKKKSSAKIKGGERIVFDSPIVFQNGEELSEFIIEKRGKAIRFARPEDTYGAYSITRWQQRPHTIK